MLTSKNLITQLTAKIHPYVWSIVLVLVFIRPFLSEQVFVEMGFWYIFIFILVGFYLALISRVDLFSHPLNFAVFVFMALIIISLFFSKILNMNFYINFLEPYFFFPNVLIFYIAGKINRKQQSQLINTVFLSAGIIGVYALYQYFFGFKHLLEYINSAGISEGIEKVLNRRRVYAFFINPNLFASYIIMILFLGVGFLLNGYPFTRKTVYIIISVCLMAAALLFTKSFSAIAVFGLIFYLLIPYFLRGFGRKMILKRVFFIITAGVFISTVLFVIFNRQRLIQSFNPADANNSIIQRYYYWITSIKIIKDFPLTGVGWRKFGIAYEFYKPVSANMSNYSHNVFLQVLAEMGVVGFIAFLSIVIIFLKTGIKVFKNGSSQQGLKIGLFCAGCSFLIHNLVDVSFYFSQVSFFWWMILGLFVNFSDEKQE